MDLSKGTWAEQRMDALEAKGRDNWDTDDWDAYNYIQYLWNSVDFGNED